MTEQRVSENVRVEVSNTGRDVGSSRAEWSQQQQEEAHVCVCLVTVATESPRLQGYYTVTADWVGGGRHYSLFFFFFYFIHQRSGSPTWFIGPFRTQPQVLALSTFFHCEHCG